MKQPLPGIVCFLTQGQARPARGPDKTKLTGSKTTLVQKGFRLIFCDKGAA